MFRRARSFSQPFQKDKLKQLECIKFACLIHSVSGPNDIPAKELIVDLSYENHSESTGHGIRSVQDPDNPDVRRTDFEQMITLHLPLTLHGSPEGLLTVRRVDNFTPLRRIPFNFGPYLDVAEQRIRVPAGGEDVQGWSVDLTVSSAASRRRTVSQPFARVEPGQMEDMTPQVQVAPEPQQPSRPSLPPSTPPRASLRLSQVPSEVEARPSPSGVSPSIAVLNSLSESTRWSSGSLAAVQNMKDNLDAAMKALRRKATRDSLVFGVRIEELGLTADGIAAPIMDCIYFLTVNDKLSEQGLYRIPGNKQHVEFYKALYNAGQGVAFPPDENPATVASVLNNFMSALPNGLVTSEEIAQLPKDYTEEPQNAIETARNVFMAIPPPRRATSRELDDATKHRHVRFHTECNKAGWCD
eukprot:c12251_g1_i1.p1 GENE.c12251_g1_i1~~c12251_g1_i1.p1  ORF type:complete len:422 (+),score=70.97 c12251_g1_i1:29-1267(+)